MVLNLAPSSRSLRIKTDDERIERYVRIAYGAMLGGAGSPATDIGVLMTRDVQPRVEFNGSPVKREWAKAGRNPWRSGAYMVDQFVWRSLAQDNDRLALYACAVIFDERAILLVGDSGVGKTTLGLALQRRGGRIVGDEMVLIDRQSFVVDAIDRALSVRWGSNDPLGDAALCAFVREHGSLVGSDERRFLSIERSAFGALPRPAVLTATFVLTRSDGATSLASRTPSGAALAVAPYVAGRPKNLDDIRGLCDILAHGTCFALDAGDPNEAASAVVNAVCAC